MNKALRTAMLELSEARELLLGVGPHGDPEEVQRALAKVHEKEGALRKALAEVPAEAKDVPGGGEDSERRELRGLIQRASLPNYLWAAMRDAPVAGAERELQVATGCDANPLPGVVVPLQMFSDTPWDPKAFDVEERVDAATNIGSLTAPLQERWVRRLFPRSVSGSMGMPVVVVSSGDYSLLQLTGGHTPAKKGRGVVQDATAATIAQNKVTPSRLVGRYLFQVEDLARFNMYESTLRADLSGAMGDQLETEIWKQAFDGYGHGETNAITLGSGKQTLANWYATLVGSVDGLYASSVAGIKCAVGVKTYQVLAAEANTDSEYVLYFARHGGISVVKNLPAYGGTSSAKVEFMWFSKGGYAAIDVPVWQGVSFIRDPYTTAASGQVALTATTLYNMVSRRSDVMTRGVFRHTA